MENKIYVRFVANHVKGFAYVSGEEDWVDKDKIAFALATGKAVVVEHPQPRVIHPNVQEVRYQTRGRKGRTDVHD